MQQQEKTGSAEARYAHDYCGTLLDVFGQPPNSTNRFAEQHDNGIHISSQTARSCADGQKQFFKDVDRYQIDQEEDRPQRSTPVASSTGWHRTLTESLTRFRGCDPSETVVMEAAFHLINSGLFKIPDVGIDNVKQCRAFLCYARWLQQRMIVKWYEEGKLHGDTVPESDRHVLPFQMALIGAGGTGKTTVLKAIEALVDHFNGPESVRK